MITVAACERVLQGLDLGSNDTPSPPAWHDDGPVRALWITRWDYRTPRDVSEAIERAAWLGVTDVFWQVRGRADAFYQSQYEPWGEELLEDLPEGATDPGFDPLQLAVVQAHAHGMRLHAWINVMPLWKGTDQPTDKSHLWHTHPEWRLYDASGHAQPLNDHYVIVNPVLEEVQDHLVRVVRDIVDHYAIDGIHLDYIRFVSESLDPDRLYPGDPRSIRLFAQATGRRGVDTEDDQRAYRAWIRSRITDLVRRIGAEAVDRKPVLIYSAAVWRDPTIGREQYLQDAALWAGEGTLDVVVPMIYTDNDEQFRRDYNAWCSAAGADRVIPGLGIYKHTDPAQSIRQVEIASSPVGYAFFAYATLFDSANPLESKTAEARAHRRVMREGIRTWVLGNQRTAEQP